MLFIDKPLISLTQFNRGFFRTCGIAVSPCAGFARSVVFNLIRAAHRRIKGDMEVKILRYVFTVYRFIVHAHHIWEFHIKRLSSIPVVCLKVSASELRSSSVNWKCLSGGRCFHDINPVGIFRKEWQKHGEMPVAEYNPLSNITSCASISQNRHLSFPSSISARCQPPAQAFRNKGIAVNLPMRMGHCNLTTSPRFSNIKMYLIFSSMRRASKCSTQSSTSLRMWDVGSSGSVIVCCGE